MPAEPIQVQGATIVISNPDLSPYLVKRHSSNHSYFKTIVVTRTDSRVGLDPLALII